MALVFPIAETAESALSADWRARSRADAQRLALAGVELVSEWMAPTRTQAKSLAKAIARGVDHGYVQVYEDADGALRLAVTFWRKLGAPPAPPKPEPEPDEAPSTPPEDHTDDLYFAKTPRKKPPVSRRGRIADPRQLDLFARPDQQGHESPAPPDPDEVIVGEGRLGGDLGTAAGPPAGKGGKRSRKRARAGD